MDDGDFDSMFEDIPEDGVFESTSAPDTASSRSSSHSRPATSAGRSSAPLKQTTFSTDYPMFVGHQPGTMPPPARVVRPDSHMALSNRSATRAPLMEELREHDENTVTHHELNFDALRTYIYPTNLELRDYQYNIVRCALFSNTLCALPTGLGKTFIASTVMLNFYRWTKTAKIIFMAPTRPLVSQQLEACLGITGIPYSESSILMGSVPPQNRQLEWSSKRVFFATPQTVDHDLKSGILDAKSICCLVIDEAHRSTGRQAYAEVVNFIARFNESFRILALTATPGSTVESVQAVVTNLKISRIEIRTESSMDIQPYIHEKNIEKVKVDFSPEQHHLLMKFCQVARPLLTDVASIAPAIVRDPEKLSLYGVNMARQSFMASPASRGHSATKGRALALFKILTPIGYAIQRLKYHGILPFYHELQKLHESGAGSKSKYLQRVLQSKEFNECMTKCSELVKLETNNVTPFFSHPKMESLVSIMKNYFSAVDYRESSRIIIFAAYRDTTAEIHRMLQLHVPDCSAHVFVGQAGKAPSTPKKGKGTKSSVDEYDNPQMDYGESPGPSKGRRKSQQSQQSPAQRGMVLDGKAASGMSQKEQQQVIADFKSGKFNTLIATSIGEEGLDIGEVDVIVCYDASASPIRMLQRIGRTGRKRSGKVYMLLTENEDSKYDKSQDNYKYIQKIITGTAQGGAQIEYGPVNRILPMAYQPTCVAEKIVIPEENEAVLQAENVLEEAELTQRRNLQRRKSGGTTTARKRQALPKIVKKFHMPDNVETGFVRASEVLTGGSGARRGSAAGTSRRDTLATEDLDGLDSSPDPFYTPPVRKKDATDEEDSDVENLTSSLVIVETEETRRPQPTTHKAPARAAVATTKPAPKPSTTARGKVFGYDPQRNGAEYGLLPPDVEAQVDQALYEIETCAAAKPGSMLREMFPNVMGVGCASTARNRGRQPRQLPRVASRPVSSVLERVASMSHGDLRDLERGYEEYKRMEGTQDPAQEFKGMIVKKVGGGGHGRKSLATIVADEMSDSEPNPVTPHKPINTSENRPSYPATTSSNHKNTRTQNITMPKKSAVVDMAGDSDDSDIQIDEDASSPALFSRKNVGANTTPTSSGSSLSSAPSSRHPKYTVTDTPRSKPSTPSSFATPRSGGSAPRRRTLAGEAAAVVRRTGQTPNQPATTSPSFVLPSFMKDKTAETSQRSSAATTAVARSTNINTAPSNAPQLSTRNKYAVGGRIRGGFGNEESNKSAAPARAPTPQLSVGNKYSSRGRIRGGFGDGDSGAPSGGKYRAPAAAQELDDLVELATPARRGARGGRGARGSTRGRGAGRGRGGRGAASSDNEDGQGDLCNTQERSEDEYGDHGSDLDDFIVDSDEVEMASDEGFFDEDSESDVRSRRRKSHGHKKRRRRRSPSSSSEQEDTGRRSGKPRKSIGFDEPLELSESEESAAESDRRPAAKTRKKQRRRGSVDAVSLSEDNEEEEYATRRRTSGARGSLRSKVFIDDDDE